MRQVRADPARRGDEVHGVVVVLLDAGRDGEHVRVEDDVLGREADFLREHFVAPFADRRLALERVRLPLLVERHDDDRRAVPLHQSRLPHELGLAFLERDGVDDRLALDAFQPGLDDFPFRGIDHQRDPGDVGLRCDEGKKAHHGRFRVEHRLVHVDVDDLGAVLHLLARDLDGPGEVAGEDQLGEGARAGDVGALADVDEQRLVVDGQRLEPGQAQRPRRRTSVDAGAHGLHRAAPPAFPDEPREPARGGTVEAALRGEEKSVDTSANPIYPENDPRHETAKVKKVIDDLIGELRDNTTHFSDPKAQMLFETSAAVLEGLRTAFEDYETHTDPSLRL